MALTRLNSFATGSVVTNAIATGEFDNIYNNALTLISPLTGNLAAGGNLITGLGLGTVGSPSLQFTGDTNTGIFSSGADALVLAGGGLSLMSLTSTPAAGIVSINPGAISATAATNVGRLFVGGGTALTIPAGVTAIVAGLWVAEPNLTATGTITSAATVYIADAPTEATNDYALWGDAGNVRFDASIGMGVTSAGSAGSIQWNATGDTGPSIFADSTTLRFKGGTTDTEWYNQANGAELMRLTNAGILLLGTTDDTAGGAGDLIFVATRGVRGNNAGTSRPMIDINSGGTDYMVNIGGGYAGVVPPNIQGQAAASFPAGSAGNNGRIGLDTTNNRFIFYIGTARYYVTGTSF